MTDEKYKHIILSSKWNAGKVEENTLKKTAIIMYLYYEDTLTNYYSYIQNIPEKIDTYIFSSNILVVENVQKYINSLGRENLYIQQKENRGRDVSALLVAAKDIVQQHEYICFVHDKKATAKYLENDTKKWVELLWENTLYSKEFILNILYEFQTNPKIGMFVPPKPIGKYMWTGLHNWWGKNLKNAENLAKELGLSCTLQESSTPIAIGTVFWAKRESLNKLLCYGWEYEDFVEEPMPSDGTISHAIERILSYVVKDMGYETMVLMADEYAQQRIEELEYFIQQTYNLLDTELGIATFHSLELFLKHKPMLLDFKQQGKKLYLYGAGKVGKCCLKILKLIDYTPSGFIVSKKTEITDIENIPIYTFDEVCDVENMKIIVSVGGAYYTDIIHFLENHNIRDYIIWEEEI